MSAAPPVPFAGFHYRTQSDYATDVDLEIVHTDYEGAAATYDAHLSLAAKATAHKPVLVNAVEVVFWPRFKSININQPHVCKRRAGFYLREVRGMVLGKYIFRNVLTLVHQLRPGTDAKAMPGDVNKEQISFQQFEYEDDTGEVTSVQLKLFVSGSEKHNDEHSSFPISFEDLLDIDEVWFQPKDRDGNDVGDANTFTTSGTGLYFNAVVAKTLDGDDNVVVEFVEQSPAAVEP